MESLKNSKIAIINGNLFLKKRFKKGTVLINNNRIKDVIIGNPDNLEDKLKNYQVIDASNCYISYGFFDPHVHFRCPGHEYKEDWDSGSKAAIKGGYTFVIDMPNNSPPAVDVESIVEKNEIAKNSLVNYGFYIGLTDENSKNINKIYKKILKKKIPVFGVKVYLGSTTGDLLVKKNSSIASGLKSRLINLYHSEDEEVLRKYSDITYNGIYDHCRRRPVKAAVSGLKRIKKSANKGCSKIYICHISSGEEIKKIEKYRKKGFNIIAEITPHHLFFYLPKISDSNNFKVNPPVRSLEDVLEIRRAFNHGFFNIIGTDHAPHLKSEKESENPPSGFPGLESSFFALYNLYEHGSIELEMVFNLLTSGYKVFDIKKRGKLKKGNFADITIVKKEKTVFKADETFTKSDFSPFDGLDAGARVNTVIINGKIVLQDGELI